MNIICNSWLRIFPPAVKNDYCEVDQKLLEARIQKVALISLACVAAAFIVVLATAGTSYTWIFTAAIYAMPLSILPMIFFPFIDSAVAERATNVKAVNEFPSPSAIRRIISHIRAAELLIEKKGNLNKRNLLGLILDNRCTFSDRFEIFKLLVENGAKVKKNFRLAVKNQNPCFLEYLTQNKKVRLEDHKADQFNHWLNIGHPQTAVLLKEFGFDVNVTDAAGRNPYMVVALQREDKASKKGHLAALKKCGAQLSTH